MENNHAITLSEITPANNVGILHLLSESNLIERINEEVEKFLQDTEPGWCVTDCITAAPPSCS